MSIKEEIELREEQPNITLYQEGIFYKYYSQNTQSER